MFDFYRGNLYSDGSLILKYLTDRDEGVYMCTATNDVGSDSMSINLTSNEAQLKRELEGILLADLNLSGSWADLYFGILVLIVERETAYLKLLNPFFMQLDQLMSVC